MPRVIAPPARSREYWIDSLRFLMALVVVNEHILKAFHPPLFDTQSSHSLATIEYIVQLIVGLFYNGAWAVSGFFVLSGYVLYSRLQGRSIPYLLGGFALKRTIRLLIPVLVMLSMVAIFASFISAIVNVFSQFYPTLYIAPQGYTHWTGPLHETFVMLPLWKDSLQNPVLWTISIELWGSMLVVLALLLSFAITLPGFHESHRLPLFVMILFFVVAPLISHHHWLGLLAGFPLGMCAWHIRQTINLARYRWALLSPGVMLCTVWVDYGDPISRIITISPLQEYLYNALGFFLIVLAISSSDSWQSILNTRILRRGGQLSYSLYLIHYPVIGLLGMPLVIILSSILNQSFAMIVVFFLMHCISYALSWGMYQWIDKPILNLLAKIDK